MRGLRFEFQGFGSSVCKVDGQQPFSSVRLRAWDLGPVKMEVLDLSPESFGFSYSRPV